MRELYEIIKKRREILKEEIQWKRIQKYFRRHYYIKTILIKQKTVDKFIINTKKQMKIFKILSSKRIIENDFNNNNENNENY